MNKLTNKEIANVFAMYLGADCKYRKGMHIVNDWGIGCFNEDGETEYKMTIGNNTFQLHDRQLLLTPVSKITDEHAIEVGKIWWPGAVNDDSLEKAVDSIQQIGGNLWNTLQYGTIWTAVYEYLKSECYAVPLWFGIDHWANGKTAIELEIAIDSTTIKP